jgi:hypothetical protein
MSDKRTKYESSTQCDAVSPGRRKAYKDGVALAAIVSLVVAVAAVALVVRGSRTISDSSSVAVRLFSGSLTIALGLSLLVGAYWLLRAVVRRRPQAGDPFDASASAECDRPFDTRLAQFLESEGAPPSAAPTFKSRMAFFMAFIPGTRHGPKPPAYIREVLERIRRLLRGASAQNGESTH